MGNPLEHSAVTDFNRTSDVAKKYKIDLPDDSGKSYKLDLPDDSGKSYKLDLPDDSGKHLDKSELFPSPFIDLEKVKAESYASGGQLEHDLEGNDAKPVSSNAIDEPRHMENGKLLPNTTYEKNGYFYKTDEKARITSAEGQIHLKNRPERLSIASSMEQVGRGDQKKSDDRAHLIADQFGGSNRLDNLVPMSANLNRGDYRAMERELANAVKDGKTVYFKVEPKYEGDSARPVVFKAEYTIGNEKFIRYFDNN